MDTQTEQQRKLAETIGAVQLGQDALQKALAAHEQDIPRLSAEVRALNCDVETLAQPLLQLSRHTRQLHRRLNVQQAHPPAKKKVERTSVKPDGGDPMALSSQH